MPDGEEIQPESWHSEMRPVLVDSFPGRSVVAISQPEFVRIFRSLSNRLQLGGSISIVFGEHTDLGNVALVSVAGRYYRVD